MTNKNNPSVKKVTGIVKNTNIGFMNVFNKDNTTAVIIAAAKLSTLMFKKCEITIIKMVEINNLIKRFFICSIFDCKYKEKRRLN